MITMGVDCSSKAVHMVVLNEDEEILAYNKVFSKSPEFPLRLIEISDKFIKQMSKINIRKTAVEKAIYIQNAKATIEIASVVTAIQLACHQQDIPCTLVDNKTWKKHIIGNGNSSKADIMKFAISKWGDIFKEQDYADAACIALYSVKDKDKED